MSLSAASHPTIRLLIKVLKKERNLTEVKINQFIAGKHLPQKRKNFKIFARRIANIVSTYDERDPDEYLFNWN